MKSSSAADVRTLLFERLDDFLLLAAGKQFMQDVFQQKLQDPVAKKGE